MALLNQSTREITGKIVYYGPGLCGKTTNLQFIYENLDDGQRGKMLSLATDTDRTLFFDFMPMDLGKVRGFKVRIQLYTVPGQVFYEETRKRVLKGADGVVFVADSQRTMREANLQSAMELTSHLKENGLDSETIPMVLQYNKRDLKDLCTVEEMDADLNPRNVPIFEAIAKEGVGVEDTLKAVSKLVLKNLMGLKQEAPREPRPLEKPAKALGERVVMDNSKLLKELGVAKTAPPPPPPKPAPAPAAKADEAQALFEDSDAVLLGAEEGGESALLEGGEASLSLEEPVLLPAPVEGEAGNSDLLGAGDPEEALDALEPADIIEELSPVGPPAQPAQVRATVSASLIEVPLLTLAPGKEFEIAIEAGGRRYRLRLRLEAETP